MKFKQDAENTWWQSKSLELTYREIRKSKCIALVMHNNHRFSKLNGKNGEKYTTNREMDRARDGTEKKICEMSIEYERMTNNKDPNMSHKKAKRKALPKWNIKAKTCHLFYINLSDWCMKLKCSFWQEHCLWLREHDFYPCFTLSSFWPSLSTPHFSSATRANSVRFDNCKLKLPTQTVFST